MATEYDAAFFDVIRGGCRRSADAVVPRFLEHYRPESVVDVGCGEGWWGAAFRDAGCDVIGLDGGEVSDAQIVVETTDLTDFGIDRGTADLAVSLEVAEHLPADAASGFVELLCGLAPVVLFSAAIPGQGGTGHLNEQWPAYWVDLFEQHGFGVSGAFRMLIWDDDRVENWYRQNMLVAAKDANLVSSLFGPGAQHLARLPLVHPVLYDARRR